MSKKKTYPDVVIGKDGWSEWLVPNPNFQIACCDCNLVHDYEFKVLFRVKRNDRSTSQLRRHDKKNYGQKKII
jgi:hypothetical protein